MRKFNNMKIFRSMVLKLCNTIGFITFCALETALRVAERDWKGEEVMEYMTKD